MDTNQKVAAVLKWAIGFVGAVLIAPYVFLAVQGIIGLGLAIATGLLVINLAPAFSVWVTNLGMRAFTGVVSRNPIESLQNLYVEKAKELQTTQANIVAFDTEIRNFKTKLKSVKANYPDEAADYEQMAHDEDNALAQMVDQYNDAKDQLASLQKDIDKAQSLYDLALSLLRVTQLNANQKTKVYQDIKRKVAFDTVQSTVNRSFAALNASVMARKERTLTLPGDSAPKALGPGVVDGEVISKQTAQRVKVQG